MLEISKTAQYHLRVDVIELGISEEERISQIVEEHYCRFRSIGYGAKIDTITDTILFKDEILDLPKIQKKLFIYLSGHVDRVQTFEDIIQNVWGMKGSSKDSLRNQVKAIRKLTYQEFIISVPGVGYYMKGCA